MPIKISLYKKNQPCRFLIISPLICCYGKRLSYKNDNNMIEQFFDTMIVASRDK